MHLPELMIPVHLNRFFPVELSNIKSSFRSHFAERSALAARQASMICRNSDSNWEAKRVDSTRRAACHRKISNPETAENPSELHAFWKKRSTFQDCVNSKIVFKRDYKTSCFLLNLFHFLRVFPPLLCVPKPFPWPVRVLHWNWAQQAPDHRIWASRSNIKFNLWPSEAFTYRRLCCLFRVLDSVCLTAKTIKTKWTLSFLLTFIPPLGIFAPPAQDKRNMFAC